MFEQTIWMIQKLLLNIKAIRLIFTKTFKIVIQKKKKRKTLSVFNDVIPDMLSNKKLNPIVTELFIRGRKLKISLVFIT